MADPTSPQTDANLSPRADARPERDPSRGTGRRAASPLRILLIVVPVVLLAAVLGFGWALGWHEPLMPYIKPAAVAARGKITYKGEPVTIGYVQTWPVSSLGEAALGGLAEDGTFELETNGQKGATVGTHHLMVLSMTSDFPPKPITPARYQQAATTPLRIEVTKDPTANLYVFELTDE